MEEQTILLDASCFPAEKFVGLFEPIVVGNDWSALENYFHCCMANREWLYLLIDNLDAYIASTQWPHIDFLLGQLGTRKQPRVIIWGTTVPRMWKSRLESMCFSDRASVVPIGDFFDLSAFTEEERQFGSWPAIRTFLLSGDHDQAARTVNSSLVSLFGSLPLNALHELRTVSSRSDNGRPKRWESSQILHQLVPFITAHSQGEPSLVALSPKFAEHFRVLAFLDELAASQVGSSPTWRARWFCVRIGRESNALWWDGWFGGTNHQQQTLEPAAFLVEVHKQLKPGQHLRVMCHDKVLNETAVRFRQLLALFQNNMLPSVEVRLIHGANAKGLHDRALFLPDLKEIVSLPIYARLVGPSPPGDYTEARSNDDEQFLVKYRLAQAAWATAIPLHQALTAPLRP